MSLKSRGPSKSNYEEATVHILSAFFCVTGQTPEDQQLRTAIEAVLVALRRAELAAAPSNIVKFCRRDMRTDN